MRRDALGTSGHVTAKFSIYSIGGDTDKGEFCKSGVYARKDSCLTTGDLQGVSGKPETGQRGTAAELPCRSQQKAVVDRFIQKAIVQVVQRYWEPHFHRNSYGFRPGAALTKRCVTLKPRSDKGTAG